MTKENKPKPQVIHRKKLFNGQGTAQEIHRRIAMAGKICGRCHAPATVRVRSFAPAKELVDRAPEYLLAMGQQNNGQIPIVEFTHGKHVYLGSVYSCESCRQQLAKDCAQGPGKENPLWKVRDSIVYEFADGPEAEKIIVQV
jgi:hypothetical protein